MERAEEDMAEARRILENAWESSSERWQDQVRTEFAAQHWEPCWQAVGQYENALRELMDTLRTARQQVE
ncbi:MAG: hypothetical protein B6D41_02595 [Chloroflexi bacterium UTCFX4]|jgi:predicted metal-dependent hydrolase|nr:MAG: hypothetical protein B6D41_02595 [Chloroflexi bacterium UTCFX4]